MQFLTIPLPTIHIRPFCFDPFPDVTATRACREQEAHTSVLTTKVRDSQEDG